jgi:hypothetical protein
MKNIAPKIYPQINLLIKDFSSINDNLAKHMGALSKPEWIFLEPKKSESGQLHFMEEQTGIPFPIKRLFWLDRIAEGATRGIHAHRDEMQVLVCLSGRVTACLEDLAGEKFLFELDSPSKALFVPPLIWTEFTFGHGAVLLGISDRLFSEKDYIRKRSDFEYLQKEFEERAKTFSN